MPDAKWRVLLVDDDDANRLTLGALLEDAGWEVLEAGSLADARRLLRGAPFAAAILDVHLGDGLGPTLIPELKKSSPSAALAVLSGSSDETFAGSDLSFAKADDPNVLLDRISRAVRERAPREHHG